MSKIVYGPFKNYRNGSMETAPGELVVTRYARNGLPVRRDYYEVKSADLPSVEIYEDGVTGKSFYETPKAIAKRVRSEFLYPTKNESKIESGSAGKLFNSYAAAITYAKQQSLLTGLSHRVTKTDKEWVVRVSGVN
jgi:hypothetical protein